MSSPGLRARKKDRTRATITRVALELFARDGFAATTLSAIADAADVSPRTVSTYFPSKEGIVFGAFEPAIDRLRARLEAREPGTPVVDVVRAWLSAEESEPADASSAIVRAPGNGEVDFARLRAEAIARDPHLWALQRRRMLDVGRLIADAAAEELGGDGLGARVIGATTVAALLELNGHAAREGVAMTDQLEVVLAFVQAGAATLQK